jgi:hypothetical protein
MVDDRIATLRHAARRYRPAQAAPVADLSGIELRLCRSGDDPQLEQLAQLAERPLPFGRFVVAAVDGRIVAALPLGGGRALADPFVRTSHLVPLLELRAAQLREPRARYRLPRYAGLLRRSRHA